MRMATRSLPATTCVQLGTTARKARPLHQCAVMRACTAPKGRLFPPQRTLGTTLLAARPCPLAPTKSSASLATTALTASRRPALLDDMDKPAVSLRRRAPGPALPATCAQQVPLPWELMTRSLTAAARLCTAHPGVAVPCSCRPGTTLAVATVPLAILRRRNANQGARRWWLWCVACKWPSV